MTRTWIITTPAAMAAALLMAHCSSSSPTASNDAGSSGDAHHGGTGTGTGTSHGSGTGTSHGSGTGTSHGSGTGTGTGHGSGTGSGSGSSTGSGSGSSTGTGSGSGSSTGTGDTDASCAPPDGGPTCTPGTVECGDAGCAVPTNGCCEPGGGVHTCQSAGTACTGTLITCEEKGDCTGGKICCLNAITASTATLSCQDGPACPAGSGLASTQICRSSAECASGSCAYYSCSATTPPTILESCDVPQGLLGGTCTKM